MSLKGVFKASYCVLLRCFYGARSKRFYSQAVGNDFVWNRPEGTDTGISIYNCNTRSKLPLILPTAGNLKWYVCGPTVYDEPHIGHACCYVRFDIIRRILVNIFNINVVYMMNITDIDDKIIAKANQIGQTTEQVSSHYESRFLQSLTRLNVMKPTVVHRVTDHIPSIISFIDRLIESGHAYATPQGDVFFKSNSYSQYGCLSRMKVQPTGESAADDRKLSPRDFALWKPSKPGEPWWESPWGQGRPGWHIECSALASEVFGENIDIHSGGADLMFPHHENELAQSNCYHQTDQWVNYWIHSGLLHNKDDHDKMSKSLGNVVTIDDLLQKYTANQFRMFCLLSPYAAVVEYGDEAMKKSVSVLKKLSSLKGLTELHIQGNNPSGGVNVDGDLLMRSLLVTQDAVKTALADNFDTRQAMSALLSLVHVCNIELRKPPTKTVVKARSVHSVAAISSYLETMMTNLGISLSANLSQSNFSTNSDQLEDVINSVIRFREKVRSFSLGEGVANASEEEKARIKAHRRSHSVLMDSCDQLRDELSTLAGVVITDTKDGKSFWHLVDKTSRDKKEK